MPRRREFRGAALGLLGAFMSRNNDVGGYWGLGKLYKHAKTAIVEEVRQLSARALKGDWLIDARIAVRFTGQASTAEPGDVFECFVTLIDDLGRQHQARDRGACWVHTPLRELKSTRV